MNITRCPRCGTPVRHINDEPRAGIPITINHRPTTWTGALLAIAGGRIAVAAHNTRGDRGGTTTTYWRLTDHRIRQGPQPGDTFHAQHTCRTHDPPAQQTTPENSVPDKPTY